MAECNRVTYHLQVRASQVEVLLFTEAKLEREKEKEIEIETLFLFLIHSLSHFLLYSLSLSTQKRRSK